MKNFLIWILCFGAALSEGWEEAALLLSGASDAESLDESVWERFHILHERPLPLNLSGRSRLLSSGLFTAYQVASLMDYRSRHGDILSAEELALVDGFGRETAAALGHFVRFDSPTLPGAPSADSLRSRARMEGEFRTKGPGGKYRVHFGENVSAGFAWRGPTPGFFGVYYGKDHLGKVAVGQFHARFGQGLALWTGFVLEDLLSPSSLVRKASGISPSWSYNGDTTLRGVAADAAAGRFDVTVFAALEGLGGNAGVSWRSGRAAVTLWWPEYGRRPRVAADLRCNPRGRQYFAEVACEPLQGAFAATGGMSAPLGEHLKGAVMLKAVPSAYSHKKSGMYGGAASLSFRAGRYVSLAGKTGFGASEIRWSGVLAGECYALPVPGTEPGRRMGRLKSLLQWQVSPSVRMQARLSGRWRNYSNEPSRAEGRLDALWEAGRWSAAVRVHGVRCGGWGLLSYAEGGWKGALLSVSLRGTVFSTGEWASRIYSYERDAPGNFNVPAYYGRGWALTGLCGLRKDWKHASVKVWARAAWVRKKPDNKVGLSIQCQWTIWGS